MNTKTEEILKELNKIIVGKEAVLEKTLMAILSRGHILLDDVPGVGKTTLALACSKVLGLDYHRIQFTPDVVPSDIIGFSMYNKESGTFEYKPGVVMTNLLLADEINRTSSKTQAALLEAMAEATATVDNVTYQLPKPFITIATQNPITSGGTQALPDSQLDRFMVRLSMGYPDVQSQVEMLMEDHGQNPIDAVQPVMSVEDLIQMRTEVANVYISYEIADYISRLVDATRHHDKIECGISPRGTKAFANMAKACAYMYDRNYVIPEDVMYVIYDIFKHRLILTPSARREKNGAENIIYDICQTTEAPSMAGERSN